MQLIHLGRQDIPQLREPVAPSAVRLGDNPVVPRELTAAEINELIDRFAHSCRRAEAAGFDAVQLHGGHGFLISNFISPFFNTRKDDWGGSTLNRARFIVKIVENARRLVGPDFPILIKMNFNDFIEGGLMQDEAIEIAKIISQAGIDAIEVTGGISSDDPLRECAQGIDSEEDEAYFRSYAKALKKQVSIPVILVGGLRSPALIDRLLNRQEADFVAMARPLICETGLVKRWRNGDTGRAKCISCNRCRENMTNSPLRCFLHNSGETAKQET